MAALNNTINLQNSVWGNGSSTAINGTIYVSPNPNTITINPSNWSVGSSTTLGTWSVNNSPYTYTYPTQLAVFKISEGLKKDEELLASRFDDILDDEMHFLPMIDGKKIEPIETIMKYIKSKKKMDIVITRIGYEIKIKGVIFKNLRNLLSKNSDTVLKVAFEYDDLIYDNTLLTLEEKRAIKVKELAKNIKKNDIQ